MLHLKQDLKPQTYGNAYICQVAVFYHLSRRRSSLLKIDKFVKDFSLIMKMSSLPYMNGFITWAVCTVLIFRTPVFPESLCVIRHKFIFLRLSGRYMFISKYTTLPMIYHLCSKQPQEIDIIFMPILWTWKESENLSSWLSFFSDGKWQDLRSVRFWRLHAQIPYNTAYRYVFNRSLFTGK